MNASNWFSLTVPPTTLAESPRFDHEKWAWVDIAGKVAYFTSGVDRDTMQANLNAVGLPDEIACILPSHSPENWVMLGREGAWLMREGKYFSFVLQAPYDPTTHRFNDGRADALGRIWVSTLNDSRQADTAELYVVDGTLGECWTADCVRRQLIVGNGLAFSPCNRYMFLADTRQRSIWRYRFDLDSGLISEQILIHTYSEGTERPDGACFSDDGTYWIAVLDGYRLDRFDLHGNLLEAVKLPVSKPTMPCFGGNSRSTLLVTCAKPSPELPNAPGFEDASVIVCEIQAHGLPEHRALLDQAVINP